MQIPAKSPSSNKTKWGFVGDAKEKKCRVLYNKQKPYTTTTPTRHHHAHSPRPRRNPSTALHLRLLDGRPFFCGAEG